MNNQIIKKSIANRLADFQINIRKKKNKFSSWDDECSYLCFKELIYKHPLRTLGCYKYESSGFMKIKVYMLNHKIYEYDSSVESFVEVSH